MFQDIRFPEDISIEFEKTICFNTEVHKTKNFIEQRIKLSNNSYNIFDINYKNLTKNKINDIVAFFNLVQGRYYEFRFKDWSDYSVLNQFLGTYNDSNNFQLIKTYSISCAENFDNCYIKKITKPVENSVKIYINNIQTTNFSVNYSNGIITINSGLSENDIITADFEFDIPVRFFSDELKIINKSKNLMEINNLKLIEVFE